MHTKAKKSGLAPASGRTSYGSTNRTTHVVGDGDGDDDWAPPRAPSKPVLTICMDTRRQAGRRGARVSISAGAATATSLGSPKSSKQPMRADPVSAVAAPATVQTAVSPVSTPRHCPWAQPLAKPTAKEGAFRVSATTCDPTRPRGHVDRAEIDAGTNGSKAEGDPKSIAATGVTPRADASNCDNVGDNTEHVGDDTNGDNVNVNSDQDNDDDDAEGSGVEKDDASGAAPRDRDGTRDRGAYGSRQDMGVGRTPAADVHDNNEAGNGRRRDRDTNKGPRMQWCRRDAALIAKTQQRERLTRRLISALVGRPYGLTLDEVATLAEEVLDKPCTVHDARLLIAELPRDMVVVRRMMTPWFVPRTAAALDTRVALDRVVAPAVAHVLRQRNVGTGVDIRHLDVAVLTNTGTSLRVHAVNYANGSIRGLLGMLAGVVGRIEDIAMRTVVYPAWHMRATALFAPLDNVPDADTGESSEQGEDGIAGGSATRSDTVTSETDTAGQTRPKAAQRGPTSDAAVSRAARATVVLVETIAEAAAACTHATEVAMASGAPIVIDARGLMVGRHARGAPLGMLQIGVPDGGPVYQLDMVGLYGIWFADPDHGHAAGSSELFTAVGVAALLGDPRVAKAVFDSRHMAQVFWRRASCPMANVFDLRLAAQALGAHVRNGWSDSDALAFVGMTIDADAGELDAMTATDAWAWHRRPMAPRARAAAARQAVVLARAYQKVNPTVAEETTEEEVSV
ncbi:Rho binding incomplete domain containing protein [Pandoravirus quercus]|uniref:Rho binding incomplete domain containing protein n=1 Tax=Pandoravirus quercus TaxID=2107709 RepID=A0A2U7U9C9_9VIRU|nr:Rho binding incomplete domain containing protein [Pandoravirus quercus]AVK75002.1 Rho binding incomplete domain containing protein [Pandoravirus quercus]